MSNYNVLGLIGDLATAHREGNLPAIAEARAALNAATFPWNQGRSYPPHVREELRALGLRSSP